MAIREDGSVQQNQKTFTQNYAFELARKPAGRNQWVWGGETHGIIDASPILVKIYENVCLSAYTYPGSVSTHKMSDKKGFRHQALA